MSARPVWYSTENGDRFPFEARDYGCWRWVAQECADDFHSNHDGWEASWPREFSIFETEDATEPLAVCDVEREAVPQFYARVRATGERS